jgi:membrane fusion protein, multidrug efflux system
MDTSTTTTGRPSTAAPEQSPKPSPERRTERRHHWWIWLILAAVVLGAAYWMYHQHEAVLQAAQARAAQQNRSVPVATATVAKGDIGVYQGGLGTVTPVATVTVTSRVQGQIMEIHYREGQMVRKGSPLIDIDPRPYEAQLSQVEGQLAHDEALLAQARIDLDRYQAAFSRNAIAQQQVYDQEQAVKQYEGTVKNDQGLVDNAKVNLVYCHITSPIDGRVGLRLVDVGNIVQANSATGLVVVAQLQPITVIFSIAQDYLPQIQQQLRQGHKMAVYAYDRPLDRTDEQQIAAGSLLTLDNQVDTSTGTVKFRAIFPNTDSALFPNQFVNAKLLVNTLHNVNVVPNAAIQRNAQGAFVYVVKPDQTASIQTVTVGMADGDITQVEGVEAGQVIVVNGFDKLQDGIKVVVHNTSGGSGKVAGSVGASSGAQASKSGGTAKP